MSALERRAYTIGEAAGVLGRSRWTIYRWLERGVLREIKAPGTSRMVDAASLDQLITGKIRVGRPRKMRSPQWVTKT